MGVSSFTRVVFDEPIVSLEVASIHSNTLRFFPIQVPREPIVSLEIGFILSNSLRSFSISYTAVSQIRYLEFFCSVLNATRNLSRSTISHLPTPRDIGLTFELAGTRSRTLHNEP
jgi:hypothetical protein